MQRFDLIAHPTAASQRRAVRAGESFVIDLTVMDVSKAKDGKLASISFAVWVEASQAGRLQQLEESVGKTPLLFSCLQGSVTGTDKTLVIKDVNTMTLEIILLSPDSGQYCLVVAKIEKK